MLEQLTFYDERFLDKYAGNIITDPITAIVELVANSWDAGATEVRISWPIESSEFFSIIDNGLGMTEDELKMRWRTLSYDRIKHQGLNVEFPPNVSLHRKAFGRNGQGRFAGFFFNNEYSIKTRKNNFEIFYTVSKGNEHPIILNEVKTNQKTEKSGTEIIVESVTNDLVFKFSPKVIKEEIGKRFLTDPDFKVYVNDDLVAFDQLPKDIIKEKIIDFPKYSTKIKIFCIDSEKTDRSSKQHGVAWIVLKRLVGEVNWKNIEDARRTSARRLTFIIYADILENSIESDWSDFKKNDHIWLDVKECILPEIHKIIDELELSSRKKIKDELKQEYLTEISNLPYISREKWNKFIDNVILECTTISDSNLRSLADILMKLEKSTSKYNLINELSKVNSNNLDDLYKIIKDWTIDMAKIVLDELENRLKLISKLESKVSDPSTLEVQELQPLFERGLWIFGPEFESIEYTSNKSINTVITNLFNKDKKGKKKKIENITKNRPDFVILPNSTLSSYSMDSYDLQSDEVNGIKKVIIVELKAPNIKVGEEEKNQAWKYVKELTSKNCIQENTDVICYVLGNKIDMYETHDRKENNIIIRPMKYDILINRAKSRTLKLYDKVKDAPAIKEDLEDFLKNSPKQTKIDY